MRASSIKLLLAMGPGSLRCQDYSLPAFIGLLMGINK